MSKVTLAQKRRGTFEQISTCRSHARKAHCGDMKAQTGSEALKLMKQYTLKQGRGYGRGTHPLALLTRQPRQAIKAPVTLLEETAAALNP